MTKLPRREFLQLAKTYDPTKHEIAGHMISEKLDGTRCFWDGGCTRGIPTEEVPWASIIDPKTGNRKSKIKPVSTGLWSRYGNPIMAPDWFLDELPTCFLDGELWAGRGNFQLCRSICGGDSPDSRFDQIKFAVYGCPPFDSIFETGEIKNSNFHAKIDYETIHGFTKQLAVPLHTLQGATFERELTYLIDVLANCKVAFVHDQTRLSEDEDEAKAKADKFLYEVVQKGGEGIIIRDPRAVYKSKRVAALMKHKPHHDDEGTLVGFTSGRKTAKGSKHLGKIGAMILDYKGKRLELSGLTDLERVFKTKQMSLYAEEHPGVDMPSDFEGQHFKVGDQITFIYRELTDDGIPKEARYLRPRDVE